MSIDFIVIVTVYGFILTVDMSVTMDVLVFMAVDQRSMAVFVCVDMGVLQGNDVPDHQYGRSDHDGKTGIERHRRALSLLENTPALYPHGGILQQRF